MRLSACPQHIVAEAIALFKKRPALSYVALHKRYASHMGSDVAGYDNALF